MPRPPRRYTPTHADGRPLKITFGEMREMGLRGVLVYCHCGRQVALGADRRPDEVRLSDIEPRFVCQGCGNRGAEVRPDFKRGDLRLAIRGYRNTR
ncbi:hypothetical protein ACVIW2_001220 [Bradyrhizobium huanghuaihaiense]|uniref:Uncharacterized protein n=1 Tax=Bradyrhizobium huanghuaihaiense TaxID=990078 RepID=A0A562RHX6_9BRAD|nr:hypothetical protein [Bradyrhizobium huanghuaihaiense]TWI68678.1 hypothetical protein IQ16_03869 [Bradyrhizobium huanghuaihaiense]